MDYLGEETEDSLEKHLDIAERFSFKARFVLVFGDINHATARTTCERLIALAHESEEPITMLISSPGGHVESGDSIHDMVRFVRPKVMMIGTGWVASAGCHIFLAADRADRFCLPNTRFMIHQPLGGVGGAATDVEIEAREIIKMRRRINQGIAAATGQPLEKVERDTDRNFWMTAEEARDYGIVGRIVSSMDEVR